MLMNALTYVFPAAAVVFIILFMWCCPGLRTAELESPQESREGFSKRDAAAVCIISAVYAVAAFWGLGNTQSAQSFCHFSERGDYAQIELETDTDITNIRFFAGLNTGKYYIQFSEDGENFTDVGTMDQSYSNIFKWCDADFDSGASMMTKYIRIISDGDLYMGELGIYDESGTLISTDRMTYTNGEAPLLDEQAVVPEEMTYLNSSYFDEVYHARTALENIDGIYPYEVSHPPLGKIIISLGMRIFGVTPFGWRFMGTLFGVLMLPCLYVTIKRMFGGTAVPACGTIVFAFDFMHYVQTRIATVDTYAVLFIILMYLFMYRYLVTDKLRYLGLSGVMFGIGAACKWTCLYAGAGLGVIWLGRWILQGKDFRFGKFLKNCLFCVVFFIIIPCAIYYASYYPYGAARGLSGPGMYFTKEYAKIVIDNQSFMFTYHEGVHSAHPYSSRWYQWIFDIRPILYYLQYVGTDKVSAFGAFVNPLLCWGGLLSMFAMGYLAVCRRDRESAFILVGWLAQLLPWVFITRTTFEYHYFACTVFLTLALCRIFALMKQGTKGWRWPVYGFTGGCVALFAMFYPALSGIAVPLSYTNNFLKWLPTWPF
jgi:dolichyl-phosphate-mannose-protein mannosyltransferase